VTVLIHSFTSGEVDAVRIYTRYSLPKLLTHVDGRWHRLPKGVESWSVARHIEYDDDSPIGRVPSTGREYYTLDIVINGMSITGIRINSRPVYISERLRVR
jgi:hypothetical protein